jgi:hypothetical protein
MSRSRPRSSAFRRSTLPLLLLAAAAPAGDDPSPPGVSGTDAAREIFRKAVAAQGEMPAEVSDVTLDFEGEISEEGEIHTVLRTYWYRSADRSFRMRTGSEAVAKLVSDRGVAGDAKYWERSPDGGILQLSRGNRDDAEQIRAIEKERAEFERMLRMVLLARFDGDGWQVTLAEPGPARLERDQPHQIKGTLGDRGKAYHVLDLRREGEPDLRLYVQTDDFTVRKAVEYDVKDSGRVRFVYYFADYRTDPDARLVLPRFFSVYRGTPSDKTERDELLAAKGEPKVRLNTGLKDSDLRPAGTGG